MSHYSNHVLYKAFNKFLIEMVKEDDLQPDFKQMNKRILGKIENFVLKSLEGEARRKNLLEDYEG